MIYECSNHLSLFTVSSDSLSCNYQLGKMDQEKIHFKCDICEKSFFNEQILGLHTKSNHKPNINTKNRCNLCENTFSCQGSLKTHVEMIHTEKKVFECEICDATFPHQRDLKHHKNSRD